MSEIMSKKLTDSDSSCEWVFVSSDEELKKRRSLEEEKPSTGTAGEENTQDESKNENKEVTIKKNNLESLDSEDKSSEVSEVEILNESEIEEMSSTFPVDDLKLSHSMTGPSEAENDDVPVEASDNQVVVASNTRQPSNLNSRYYMIWTVIWLVLLGSPHLLEWSSYQLSYKSLDDMVDFSEERSIIEKLCRKSKGYFDDRFWEHNLIEVLKQNGDLKEALTEYIKTENQHGRKLNFDSPQAPEPDVDKWKEKFHKALNKNENLKKMLMESDHSSPEDAEKTAVEEVNAHTEVMKLKNKLNEMKIENEEMKRIIGKLRYHEISNLNKLIENHSYIINDLRNENDDLKKIVVRLRYSDEKNPEPEIGKCSPLTNVERNIIALKEDINHIKSTFSFNDEKKEQKNINILLDEMFQSIMNLTKNGAISNLDIVQSKVLNIIVTAYEKVQAILKNHFQNVDDSNPENVQEAQKKINDIMLAAIVEIEKTGRKKEGKEVPNMLGSFATYFENHLSEVKKSFSKNSKYSGDNKLLMRIFNATMKTFDNMKNNLQEKVSSIRDIDTESTVESAKQAYNNMNKMFQEVTENVKSVAENMLSNDEKPKAVLGRVKTVLNELQGKWSKHLKSFWKSDRQKTKKDPLGDEETRKDVDWVNVRAESREEKREMGEKDWSIQRGENRREKFVEQDSSGKKHANRRKRQDNKKNTKKLHKTKRR